MKILFAAMEWDYGFPEHGHSFEFTNLYDALRRMEGIDARLFDFLEAFQKGGHEEVRRKTLEIVGDWRPHLLFTVLFRDEFPHDLLVELRDRSDITTFNWFCDDHWRFESFTSVYAPLFNACSTTAESAIPKYRAIGYENVIKTQWGCNHHLYRLTPGDPLCPVSFVGQPHGDRRKVIAGLRKKGIQVETWGTGWERGRIEQEAMVELFSRSLINLNLSNASRRRLRSHWWKRGIYDDQIKGRNFEIPGCGGFQLSGRAENLEQYFEPEREISLYGDREELTAKVFEFLGDDKKRRAIALAGYRRTLAEHTYERRFRAILSTLGFANSSI